MSFQTSNSGAFRSLHCLIYKVLAAASVAEHFLFYHTFLSLSSTFFNFFRSFFSTLLALLSASKSFVILSHQLSFVKCFFQLFQSFFGPRLASSLFLSKAWLSYHICFRLSSAFFRFFWTFFPRPSRTPPPSRTARLLYQILHPLSIPFLKKICVFFALKQRHFLSIVI